MSPLLSTPFNGVYGRSTWISSSLMYIDHIDASLSSFKCRRWGGATILRSLVSGPDASVEASLVGTYCVGDTLASTRGGSMMLGSSRKKYTENPAANAVNILTIRPRIGSVGSNRRTGSWLDGGRSGGGSDSNSGWDF